MSRWAPHTQIAAARRQPSRCGSRASPRSSAAPTRHVDERVGSPVERGRRQLAAMACACRARAEKRSRRSVLVRIGSVGQASQNASRSSSRAASRHAAAHRGGREDAQRSRSGRRAGVARRRGRAGGSRRGSRPPRHIVLPLIALPNQAIENGHGRVLGLGTPSGPDAARRLRGTLACRASRRGVNRAPKAPRWSRVSVCRHCGHDIAGTARASGKRPPRKACATMDAARVESHRRRAAIRRRRGSRRA